MRAAHFQVSMLTFPTSSALSVSLSPAFRAAMYHIHIAASSARGLGASGDEHSIVNEASVIFQVRSHSLSVVFFVLAHTVAAGL